MGAKAVITKWFPSGFRLINGLTLTNWFNNPQCSYEDNITAHAGGGQANAYQITGATSRLTTVATNADSVKLYPSSQWLGGEYIIINDGAANADVYPGNTTDNIDGTGAGQPVVITAGKRTSFFATSKGIISSSEGSKST